MNKSFLAVLLMLSAFFALSAIVWIALRIIRSLFNKTNPNSRIVWYLLLFVASVWCLRYSVGYYSVYHADTGLTKYEEIFNSIVHTFQSFSMDEDYTQYISTGKDMIKYLLGENTKWAAVYGIYASALNVLAPICGGAILLNILQGVFPEVKLFFKKLAFWKTKYYFSELNDNSLACAKGILNRKFHIFCKPVIVFTDVYTDGEDEKSSELLKKAKAIGGICINDDLTHINHRHTSKKEYWLIDEKEIDNIKTLAELSDDKHCKKIAKTIIRIFYQDDSYSLTEKVIVEQISQKYSSNEKKMPAVIRTRCYQNLVYDLLKEEPLYMPLLGCGQSKSLDVAILGNGCIGTEMFLSAYWCGQMYGIPLSINMVSKDEPEVAKAKIDKISNEILESSRVKSKLLKVYRDFEEYNDPYFTFRYCKSDVDYADISQIECVEPFESDDAHNHTKLSLIDANYYLVALGDDDVNIRVAERLLKAILIRQKETGNYKKVTIAYVVYDSHLCFTLNEYQNKDRTHEQIRMKAVGSTDDTYSYENIVKIEYMQSKLERKNGNGRMDYADWVSLCKDMTTSKKSYDFWSDYARNIHYGYKVFSAYHADGKNMCEWDSWKQCHTEYICKEKDSLADKLAWAEHRRWSAYLRSIGFRYNEDKDVAFLRTHDCLVEHRKPGATFDPACDDLLEEVKRDPNIIKYDYDGIISKGAYDKLAGKAE